MHLARQKRVIAFALAAGLVVGVGCTMVGDNLTGVQLDRGQPTTCVKQCNDSYKLLYQEEQKRHQAAVASCQALPQPAKAACLDAETATHEANKATLSQGKTDCQNNCHRQGSGSAG